jgi:hypothetical protein
MGEHSATKVADQVHLPKEQATVAESHPLAGLNPDTIQAAKACANSGLPAAQRAVNAEIGSCQITNDGGGTSHSVFRDATGAAWQLTASDSQGPAMQLTRNGTGDQWTVSTRDKTGDLAPQLDVSNVRVSPDGKSFSFTGPHGEHVTSNEYGNTIVTKEGRTIVQSSNATTEYPSPAEIHEGFHTTTHFADGRVRVLGEGKQQLTVNPDGTGSITFADGFEKQINPPYSADEMKMFKNSSIAKLTELPDHHLKVEMKQLADSLAKP